MGHQRWSPAGVRKDTISSENVQNQGPREMGYIWHSKDI